MKNLCLILSLLLLISLLTGCKAAGGAQLNNGGQQTDPPPTSAPTLPSTPPQPTIPLEPPFRETIPVTQPQPDKIICEATLENDFSNNELIMGVYPQWNLFEFTVDDFAEIGCIAIREIFRAEQTDTPSRMFVLTLDKTSKQNVLDCIKILEQRPEVFFSEPNYSFPIPEM